MDDLTKAERAVLVAAQDLDTGDIDSIRRCGCVDLADALLELLSEQLERAREFGLMR